MPVILNLKRCDNVKECGAPAKCQTGAFFWNEEKHSLDVQIEKCINCHLCENCCPTGAITVFDDENEYKSALKLLAQDKSTIKDLFVDRYGAMVVANTNVIDSSQIDKVIENAKKKIAIEIVDANNPLCLISAVPYSTLFKNKSIKLFKIMTTDDDLLYVQNKLKLKNVPALLIVENGYVKNKFEGVVEFGTDNVKLLMQFIEQNI